MSDHKNLWIGVLTLSAVVLFSTLVLLDRSALADGACLDKGGDYTMCTGSLAGAGDGVYIIDSQMSKINLYHLQPGANKLILTTPRDLKAPQAAPRR